MKNHCVLISSAVLLVWISAHVAIAQTTKYPTLSVKIHRIQGIDPIENILEGSPDWHFYVHIWDGDQWLTQDGTAGGNDVIVDSIFSFEVKIALPTIAIQLLEDDTLTVDDVADISSYPGGGQDNTNIPPRGAYYRATFDLRTGDLEGDTVVVETGYWKTSGDYDGSVEVDENDANLWFDIWDNYNAPVADAGADKEIYTGDKVNFDASGSMASIGSSIIRYEWDFENDGVIDAEGEKTSYTYHEKGTHTCRLRATDSLGEWNEDTCLVLVLNRAPTADFTYSPTNPTIQDTLYFFDTSSDPDGSITSWQWNFGDGNYSNVQSPSHKYEDKGTYLVSLRVTDDSGAPTAKQKSIKVWNTPPAAGFSFSPPDPLAAEDVQFNDESYDLEGRSLTYLWDFGDGYTSNKSNPRHAFSSPEKYTISLTVWDDEQSASTITKNITVVQNLPPTSDFSLTPPNPLIGEEISFSDLSEDPENRGLTCFWDFGDGHNSSAPNPTHAYAAPGQYIINLTVWDNAGQFATATKTINVSPPPFIGTPLFYILVAIVIIATTSIATVAFIRKRKTQKLSKNVP